MNKHHYLCHPLVLSSLTLKVRRLRPCLNPRTWVLKASTLPLDHRKMFVVFLSQSSEMSWLNFKFKFYRLPYTYFPTNSSTLPSHSTSLTAHCVALTSHVQWLGLGWNARNRLKIHCTIERFISSPKRLDRSVVSYREHFPWGKKWPGREAAHSHPLVQCFSTAGPRPGTGPWHQLYRAARGSPGICHFSFLSIFH